jgi:hypothetical protein
MGGGALIQLAAYGTQNIYLTGDPQITYWKTVYKRYTNFSIESVEQNISGNILAGKSISVTISRDGDLLKNLFIQYNPQQIYNGNNVTFDNGGIPSNLGNTILKQMELEIGGNLIDRQYGIWLTIWNNITTINYITPSPPVDTFLQQGCTGVEPSVSTLSNRTGYNHQQQNTEFDFELITDYNYDGSQPFNHLSSYNICINYTISADTFIPTSGSFTISINNINNLETLSNVNSVYMYFFVMANSGKSYICSYTGITTASGITSISGCIPLQGYPLVNDPILANSSSYLTPALKNTGTTYGSFYNQIYSGNRDFYYLEVYSFFMGFRSKGTYTIYIDGITDPTNAGYKIYNGTYEQLFLDWASRFDGLKTLGIFDLGYIPGIKNRLDTTPTANRTLTLNDYVVFNDLPIISNEFNVLHTSGVSTLLLSSPINLNYYQTILPPESGVLITTYNNVKYYLTYSDLSYKYMYAVYDNRTTYIFNIINIISYPLTYITIPIDTTVYFIYYNYNLSNAPTEAYIPMKFWFCKNPGLALPLIALQFHEVKFNIQLADYKELHATKFTDVNLTSFKVFADFVYLDSNERRLFAQNAHEYLIEQLQHNVFNNSFTSNISGGKLQINLNFANPVKEIVFCGYPDSVGIDSGGIATPTNLLTNSSVNLSNVQLGMVFDQVNRFSSRNLKYFTRNQIWDSSNAYDINDNIGVYSFSLRPEETQPSGSCNFSRIINPYLVFSNFAPGEELNYIDIYATNYNILRIMSGMGNLAFAY